MPYQVEETGTYSRKVQVTVPAEDYQQEMNKTLRKLSKRVKISGFRKGKIPLSVMQRHYGEQVRGDVIEQLLRDHIDQVLSEQEKVIYLGQPSISALPQIVLLLVSADVLVWSDRCDHLELFFLRFRVVFPQSCFASLQELCFLGALGA